MTRRHLLPDLLVVLCLLLLSVAIGQLQGSDARRDIGTATHSRSKPQFTFYLENDTIADADGHYTNGLKLSWVTADLTTWSQTGWRERFVHALPFVNRPDAQKNFGFAFGQNIYTPQDITRVPPDPTDRPYAGWTYLEFSFASRTRTIMDTLSFQFGVVGPHSYAEDAQKLVHEWLNDTRPLGWDHQLQDEIGVNVSFERRTRLYAHTARNLLGVDFVPRVGLTLGNVHTHASVGGTVRVGLNLPQDFGVDLIGGSGPGNTPVTENDPRVRGSASLFLFGGAEGRAVVQDIFLDGNSFKDGPRVERKPFVADVYYGLGAVLGNWQCTFTVVERTLEFRGQEGSNRFGSLTVSVAW